MQPEEVAAALAAGVVDPAVMARLIAETPAQWLREVLAGGSRGAVLDEVFRRLPEYLDTSRARDLRAAVGWTITGRTDGGADRFAMIVEDGACRAARDLDATVRLQLELDAVDFLRLVTGNANPAVLFLSGGLRLLGEERLVLELAACFRVPTSEGTAPLEVDPSAVDALTVARVVRSAADDELRKRLRGGLREVVLDEVFRRFPDYLDPSATRGMRAVIAWRIGGRADGDADRYIVVIEDGACRAGRDITAEPQLTISLDAVDFLKLATGNRNPVTSFLRGRVRVRGDLALAARLPGAFRIPSAG